jgi:hypothetical protein
LLAHPSVPKQTVSKRFFLKKEAKTFCPFGFFAAAAPKPNG